MTKIEETLKKISSATSRVGTSTNPNDGAEGAVPNRDLPGDPNCPVCHGLWFVRQNLPITDPDFGKVNPCTCLQGRITQAARQRLYRMSNLDSLQELTFETFQPNGRLGMGRQQAASLELAYNHSRQFASSLKGWLLLTGGYGCGKTHLAAAIANFTVSMGVRTLFITAPPRTIDWPASELAHPQEHIHTQQKPQNHTEICLRMRKCVWGSWCEHLNLKHRL